MPYREAVAFMQRSSNEGRMDTRIQTGCSRVPWGGYKNRDIEDSGLKR